MDICEDETMKIARISSRKDLKIVEKWDKRIGGRPDMVVMSDRYIIRLDNFDVEKNAKIIGVLLQINQGRIAGIC